MTDEPESPSKRRASTVFRVSAREAQAASREALFEALASGFTHQQIAEARGVSARTIRREIDRAVEEKRLDAPDRYVHLQVRRLTKALRAADARIDRGDMAAVAPFLKVVAALDRYHGLKEPFRPSQRARRAIPPDPAPPLALPCPAPALDDLAPEVE